MPAIKKLTVHLCSVQKLMIKNERTSVRPEREKNQVSGKTVARKQYVHINSLKEVPEPHKTLISNAIASHPDLANCFNVIKFDETYRTTSLLSYPTLGDAAFPELAESWVLSSDGKMKYRDYRQSLNPPILHRKELLLPSNHPGVADAIRLTSELEEIGAFDDTTRIGYRKQWNLLLRSLGFFIEELSLVPIGNASEEELTPHEEDASILRHRTALVRDSLSAPVQLLFRYGILHSQVMFFDYGCGRGDDVRGVQALGIKSDGWDPYFANEAQRLTDLPPAGVPVISREVRV